MVSVLVTLSFPIKAVARNKTKQNIEFRNKYSPCILCIKIQAVFCGKTLTGRRSVGDA